LADPRVPEKIVRDLAAWCASNGVPRLAELSGALVWPE
jgi:hypothetical protein